MDDCAAKVKADGEAEAKAYKEYFDWCDDTAKNTQFDIKTHTSEKEDLEATIGEETANIQASTTKIEELSAAIASDTAELEDTVDTLERAVAILEREMAKAPGSFAQIDTANTKMLAQALGAVVDAASFSAHDKNKLAA